MFNMQRLLIEFVFRIMLLPLCPQSHWNLALQILLFCSTNFRESGILYYFNVRWGAQKRSVNSPTSSLSLIVTERLNFCDIIPELEFGRAQQVMKTPNGRGTIKVPCRRWTLARLLNLCNTILIENLILIYNVEHPITANWMILFYQL